MPSDISEQKVALRSWAQRQPPADAGEIEGLLTSLTTWLMERKPCGVLIYLSMPGELPADRVIELARPHRYLVTRTPPTGPLTIHDHSAPRERHRFGYENPVADAPIVPASDVGVVLVPGLCFDRGGGRLGWGKGYYDRLLVQMRSGTPLVGVTIDRLVVDHIPTEPHDRSMTHLATESGVRPVDGGGVGGS